MMMMMMRRRRRRRPGGTVPSSERRDVTDEVPPYRTVGEPSAIYSGVFPFHKGQASPGPFSQVDTVPAALRMARAAPETGDGIFD